MNQTAAPDRPTHGVRLPLRMHHHAFVTADQERTRHFYEDIIGLPLRATWVETEHFRGETLCSATRSMAWRMAARLPSSISRTRNCKPVSIWGRKRISATISRFPSNAETQQQIVDRCAAAHIETAVIDHGYCKSLYITDPDGLQVEFTVDAPNVNEINEYQRRVAHKSLQAWQAGDTRPNNNVRPQSSKLLRPRPPIRSADRLTTFQVAMRLLRVSQGVRSGRWRDATCALDGGE